MDVPAPFGGTVAEIRVSVGDTVSEGSPILALQVQANGAQPAGRRPTPRRRRPADEPRRARRRARAAPSPQAAPAVGRGRRAALRQSRRAPPRARAGRRPERGGGLRTQGRITKEDVRAAAEGRPAARGARRRAGHRAGPRPVAEGGLREVRARSSASRCSRIQKISGPNLARNWVMIPHVTHHDEADITELEAFRKRTNAEHAKQGVKVTMVALLLKASVAALTPLPEQFNASLDGDDLVLKRYYHLGFAADTPQRARGAGDPRRRPQGPDRDRRRADRAVGTAREGKLKGEEMRGRHVHDLLAGRHRRHRLHADRQRAGGRDPRRRRARR